VNLGVAIANEGLLSIHRRLLNGVQLLQAALVDVVGRVNGCVQGLCVLSVVAALIHAHQQVVLRVSFGERLQALVIFFCVLV